MIVGNTIKFGYGDIATASDSFTGMLVFNWFKPSVNVGDPIPYETVEFQEEMVNVRFSYEEAMLFKNNLNDILERKYFEFEMNGFVFDFTNYNEKSVDIIIGAINRVIRGYIKLMAC